MSASPTDRPLVSVVIETVTARYDLTARRIALDWARLARARRQIGFGVLALPYLGVVAATLRLVEFGGMVAAVVMPARDAGGNLAAAPASSRA